MAKKSDKTTKLVRGGIIYSTITAENPFYADHPQELQLALYLTSAGKNSISMKNEGNAFPFTDYVVSEINEVDENGTITKTERFVVAYDVISHTCYFTMSRGLAREFDELNKNRIIPSTDRCRWIGKASEVQFKTDDGKTARTFNLDIIGIEKFPNTENAPAPAPTPQIESIEEHDDSVIDTE